ncbi:hypothetical protein EV1_001391 [Malus domestica]
MMAETILSSKTTDIPASVKIKVHTKIIEVEGPHEKLIRNFKLSLQIMDLSNSKLHLVLILNKEFDV